MNRRFLLTMGLVFLLGPGCGGTGTGSPTVFTSGPGGPSVPTANPTESALILQALCGVLVSCSSGGLTETACEYGILSTSGFAGSLGLLPGIYGDYDEINNAEAEGAIVPNKTAGGNCISEIQALSCSDAAVEAAYQPAAGNPFAQAPGMMPAQAGGCGSVF